MLKKNTYVWIFTASVSILSLPFSNAGISYLDLKGVHELIKPEFEAYSPVNGYGLLGGNLLQNFRFFGNYGPKKNTHGCMGDVPAYSEGFTAQNGDHVPGLKEREDCPQDFTDTSSMKGIGFNTS